MGCWEGSILEVVGACWCSLAVVLGCPATSMPVPGLPVSCVLCESGTHPSELLSCFLLLATESADSFLPVRKG